MTAYTTIKKNEEKYMYLDKIEPDYKPVYFSIMDNGCCYFFKSYNAAMKIYDWLSTDNYYAPVHDKYFIPSYDDDDIVWFDESHVDEIVSYVRKDK